MKPKKLFTARELKTLEKTRTDNPQAVSRSRTRRVCISCQEVEMVVPVVDLYPLCQGCRHDLFIDQGKLIAAGELERSINESHQLVEAFESINSVQHQIELSKRKAWGKFSGEVFKISLKKYPRTGSVEAVPVDFVRTPFPFLPVEECRICLFV